MRAPEIALDANARIAADALVWRRCGAVFVSVVVKTKVRLFHERPASIECAAPVLAAEGDLVPRRLRCDVTVTGRFAPAKVRLLVARELTPVIDKAVSVDGFSDAIAALAAVPPSWHPPEGVLEVPGDLSWEFFQTAPRDQQVEGMRGDEWIILEGFTRDLARVVARLPGARAVVRYGPKSAHAAPPGQTMETALDSVAIDTDEMTATLAWRATMPVPAGVVALAQLRFEASLAFERLSSMDASTTAPVDEGLAARPVAPFAIPEGRTNARRSAPIPGSPWARLAR